MQEKGLIYKSLDVAQAALLAEGLRDERQGRELTPRDLFRVGVHAAD